MRYAIAVHAFEIHVPPIISKIFPLVSKKKLKSRIFCVNRKISEFSSRILCVPKEVLKDFFFGEQVNSSFVSGLY